MSIPNEATERESPRSNGREVADNTPIWKNHEATKAELIAALAREEEALRVKNELLQRQEMLAQEFEHRLVNSLQLIVSMLSLQSRAATTVEASTQLTIAASRVAAIGRVHRRLHLLDHETSVEFKEYLKGLCDDLSGLLFQGEADRAVVVTGAEIRLPTALGIPLGFIVNELVTNSVKYANGNITVRIETAANSHSLSIVDEGPGLPEAFNPANGRGLGMKIVQSLVKQIGGTLQFAPGDGGRGSRFTVAFATQPQAETQAIR